MAFRIDRYHAVMGDGALKETSRLRNGSLLGDETACFYVTQRKIPYAPCVGHERLIKLLSESHLDRPRSRFLEKDRAGLKLFAKAMEDVKVSGLVRAVAPGTIMFANEPFADITGPFSTTQAQEIKFEHAFDLPMTTAGLAMQFRLAAEEERWLSDFSQRRCGDIERAIDIASYAYIGGFDDTSNMEAAHRFEIPAIGTEAHCWQQAFIEYMRNPEIEPRTGKPKHFQQTAFERWLDANPNGTTLLLDTIDTQLGAVHAAMAATSTEARRKAFKGYRIDSGNLIAEGIWCCEFFKHNGLHNLLITLTGDITVQKVRDIVREFPQVSGFGVGTKLAAELDKVAGVIFKLCSIGNLPTLKASNTPDKSTLPGKLQVFRGIDMDGNYTSDVIGFEDERFKDLDLNGADDYIPLLQPFWDCGKHMIIPSKHSQKEFVQLQIPKFGDIENYPVRLSHKLRETRDFLIRRMHEDNSEWQTILNVSEENPSDHQGKSSER